MSAGARALDGARHSPPPRFTQHPWALAPLILPDSRPFGFGGFPAEQADVLLRAVERVYDEVRERLVGDLTTADVIDARPAMTGHSQPGDSDSVRYHLVPAESYSLIVELVGARQEFERAESRRNELIKTALMADVSVANIAAACGLSGPTLYKWRECLVEEGE